MEEKVWIQRAFEEEEVITTINSCAPDKAPDPGPDGYTMAFFQKAWDFIKPVIMTVVNHFDQNKTKQNNIHSIIPYLVEVQRLFPKTLGSRIK